MVSNLANTRCSDKSISKMITDMLARYLKFSSTSDRLRIPYILNFIDILPLPREFLSMQEMVGGDNNRTPVKYQVSDILVFIGVIHGAR